MELPLFKFPNCFIPSINFENFFVLLPDNIIIAGNLNAHSFLWSCITPNMVGIYLYNSLSNSFFILLNNNSLSVRLNLDYT